MKAVVHCCCTGQDFHSSINTCVPKNIYVLYNALLSGVISKREFSGYTRVLVFPKRKKCTKEMNIVCGGALLEEIEKEAGNILMILKNVVCDYLTNLYK